MIIELRCVDGGHKNECWKASFGEKVVLTGPDGNTVAQFDPLEAISHFRMPNFWQNIRYFGVRLEDGLWQFDLRKSDMRRIEQFIDRTVAAGGPSALGNVWTAAAVSIVLGGAAIIGGTLITVLSYKQAASKPFGGQYTIYYGLVVVGLLMLGQGFRGLRRHRELEHLSREPARPGETVPQPQSVSAGASFGPPWGERPVPGPEQADRIHDEAMIGGRRIPVLKVVVAMFIVFAGLEAFVFWRDRRPGPAPAQAVGKNEQTQLPSAPEVPPALRDKWPAAIEGLRACALFTGRFPETLGPELSQIAGQLRSSAPSAAPDVGLDPGPRKTMEEKAQCVEVLQMLYCALEAARREPAYYGKVVKPGEAKRVLLYWRMSPKVYRVVYGDLRTQCVITERPTELGTPPPR